MDQARELVSVVGPQGVGGEDMVSVFLPPTPFFMEAANFLTDLFRLGARQRIHPTNERGATMDTIVSWVAFVGLAAILVYSKWKEQPTRSEPAHRGGKPLPHNRVARMFVTFQGMDWSLFISALVFLFSAVAGTTDDLR